MSIFMCVLHTNTNTPAMIPTYNRVLSAIKKALWELMEEYQGVGKSLLLESQKVDLVSFHFFSFFNLFFHLFSLCSIFSIKS